MRVVGKSGMPEHQSHMGVKVVGFLGVKPFLISSGKVEIVYIAAFDHAFGHLEYYLCVGRIVAAAVAAAVGVADYPVIVGKSLRVSDPGFGTGHEFGAAS